MNTWVLAVCMLTSILLIYLFVKEYKRLNRRHRLLRLIASVITVASLALFAIPITYKTAISARTAILLTDGFDIDSLEKFQKQYKRPILIYSAGTTKNNNVNSINIHSASITDTLKKFDTIHVFGYGLPKEKWLRFRDINLYFHPSPQPNGFIVANWTRSLQSGENFSVQGRVSYNGDDEVTVVLSSAGEKLDSFRISHGKMSFRLVDQPRQVGRTTYQLTLLRANDTIEKASIPFEVFPQRSSSILALSSAPDFETRFLKNWLTSNQFQFAQRTRISSDKYDQQYINRKPTPLLRVTSSLLDQFTLLICDVTALNALSATEQIAIRKQVQEKGLGLVIRASSGEQKSNFLNQFSLTRLNTAESKSLILTSSSLYKPFPGLVVDQPTFIAPTPNIKSIISAGRYGNTAAASLNGRGKVVVTTINNTYNWILAGSAKDYHQYWSQLLNEASSTDMNDASWRFKPANPRINEEVQIIVDQAEDSIPILFAGDVFLPARQNSLQRASWSSSWWPLHKGWHQVTNRSTGSKWVYVSDPDEWQALNAFETLTAMKQFRDTQQQGSIKNQPAYADKAVAPIYFFILFILSAAYLWLEKKLVTSS